MRFTIGTEAPRQPTPLEMMQSLRRGQMPRRTERVIHAVEVGPSGAVAPRAACGQPAGHLIMIRRGLPELMVDWSPRDRYACRRCIEAITRRARASEKLEPLRQRVSVQD